MNQISSVIKHSSTSFASQHELGWSQGSYREVELVPLPVVHAYDRSYAGPPSWEFVDPNAISTTASSHADLVVGPVRLEDRLIAQVVDFRTLMEGWDGQDAARPSSNSLRDAIRFIRAAGSQVEGLEPSLHVDGSVLLEVGTGKQGSFRFKGDGQVIYASDSGHQGIASLEVFFLPKEIKLNLFG